MSIPAQRRPPDSHLALGASQDRCRLILATNRFIFFGINMNAGIGVALRAEAYGQLGALEQAHRVIGVIGVVDLEADDLGL